MLKSSNLASVFANSTSMAMEDGELQIASCTSEHSGVWGDAGTSAVDLLECGAPLLRVRNSTICCVPD